MYSDYRCAPGNPFEKFLVVAEQAMRLGVHASKLSAIASTQGAEFTLNTEQRNFCSDVFSRIERMAFAFDRLCELTVEHYKFYDTVDAKQDASGTHTYSDEETQAMARWHTEADLLTFSIYYELKSIVDMMEQWGIAPAVGCELEYAIKARDRFLAHPEFHRVAPHAYRGKAIPYRTGFTCCDIGGLQQWDSVTREQYFLLLGLTGSLKPELEAALVAENETAIRSATKNERLTAEQVTRLKAFGAREPDLEKALCELAADLLPRVLNKIEEIHQEAITRFGFEYGPSGPLMSTKITF
jgi:hypothetical protein